MPETDGSKNIPVDTGFNTCMNQYMECKAIQLLAYPRSHTLAQHRVKCTAFYIGLLQFGLVCLCRLLSIYSTFLNQTFRPSSKIISDECQKSGQRLYLMI